MADEEKPRDATVHLLPVWKKGATAADWFADMMTIARLHPERTQKMVLVYQIEKKGGNIETHYYCGPQMTTNELIGILEIGKIEVVEYVTRRRPK